MGAPSRTGTASGKIRPLEELATLAASLREQRKTIVHCHGVFDLLHIGHIRYFEQAKAMGDVLVVTVTPDRHVNKGPGRPAFPEALRAEAVASLAAVDYVAINQWPTAVETLQKLRPDVYVKGPDYRRPEEDVTGGIQQEADAARSVGARLAFTDDVVYSSSQLINRHLAPPPPTTAAFFDEIRGRHGAEGLRRYLDRAAGLRALVVGETIIDEYQYCITMGKSGKEPILAARALDLERFAGGILAVANHVAAFCEHVTLLTFLGSRDSHEGFINERLSPRVHPVFLRLENAPTLVKRRMVETYPLQKLFELYVMQEAEDYDRQSPLLLEHLDRLLPDHDLTIVTDYGHGMLGPDAVRTICQKARFLAVNTQTNAANHGFNTISRYPRADYVCISEGEVRLDVRSRRQDLSDIVRALASKLACERVVITRGRTGSLCYDPAGGFRDVPAFTSHIVDRVGAGDAVFAVTSLCAQQGAPGDVLGFIGNAVGAQAVGIVGNRQAVERAAVLKYMDALLK
jgi:rfaE bifunctional protein nucleotidyltransferase chain/domain